MEEFSNNLKRRLSLNKKPKKTSPDDISFTSTVKVCRKSVTWCIENFEYSPFRNGEYLESPMFTTGYNSVVTQWVLRVYPRGRLNWNPSDVGLYIQKISSDKEFALKYKMFKLYKYKERGLIREEEVVSSESEDGCWGEECAIVNAELKDKYSGILAENNLNISCELTVGYLDSTQETTTGVKSYLMENTTSLSKDLERLCLDAKSSDVILKVGKTHFPAHRIILSARSDSFTKLLDEKREGLEANTIPIEDVDPSAVKKILKYFYTGKVEDMSLDKTIQLYLAAEKFKLSDLTEKCEEAITSKMTADNVFMVAQEAYSVGRKGLKAAIKNCFSNYGSQIFEQSRWKKLVKEKPELASELIENVVSNYKTRCEKAHSDSNLSLK